MYITIVKDAVLPNTGSSRVAAVVTAISLVVVAAVVVTTVARLAAKASK